MFRSHPDYSQEQEELRLHCQEKKLQKQAEVIRGALNELGCEELPSGCDLSMEGSFSEPSKVDWNQLFNMKKTE